MQAIYFQHASVLNQNLFYGPKILFVAIHENEAERTDGLNSTEITLYHLNCRIALDLFILCYLQGNVHRLLWMAKTRWQMGWIWNENTCRDAAVMMLGLVIFPLSQAYRTTLSHQFSARSMLHSPLLLGSYRG